MKWVEYDKVLRSRNIGKLLGLVRLALLEPTVCVSDVLENNRLLILIH